MIQPVAEYELPLNGMISLRARRMRMLFALLLLLLILFFFLDIFLGSVEIRASDVLKALFTGTGGNVETIILKFRLPKAMTALVVGIALSLSGLQMQTIFRNPMAGPDVLGVSSGASLGVAIVLLGFSSSIIPANLQSLGNWMVVISAWIGAGAVMLLIMVISSRIRDIMIILIIGIMLAGGISSIVSIMQYFSNETLLKSYVIWTMGSLGNLSSSQLRVLLITVSGGVILGVLSIKMLNALLLGENYAGSIGLNVRISRIVIFTCTSILAGSVTAFCGPIGFIGIAVPHIARRLFRTSDHRILVPGTIICGGAIMLLSDVISQLPGSDRVLPLNSITSLIGIPIVLWVLLRNKKITGSF
jgi:iron complex transport system permease protein